MFANQSIAKRLNIAFLLISLLVAVSGVFGIVMIHRVSRDADIIFEEKYPVAHEAQFLSIAINSELLAIHSYILGEESAEALIEKWHDQFKEHLTVLEEYVNTKDVAAIGTIRDLHENMAELSDELIVKVKNNTPIEQLKELLAQEEKDLDQIMADIELIVQHAEEEMQSAMDNADRLQNQSVLLLIVLALLSFACAAWLGKKIANGITRPLNALVNYSAHIASGNLNEKISGDDAKDETGTLARAFGTMTHSLREITAAAEQIAQGDLTADVEPRSDEDTLGLALQKMIISLRSQIQEILDGAGTIASSVSELSASSSQLASSAAENSTSISETTATVEEVRQTAELANSKAEQMAEDSHRIRETSKQGRDATEETVSSMNKIQTQMSTIAETIISLSEQSQAIGQIIATVDSLSEQSNVLAVNASIEAAKAGEQGKGFSVVAQEVKSLAEQSKQATTQVRNILSEIQKATSTAVMATEQGNKVVEKGTDTAITAGQAIINLTSNMDQTSDAAIQIAAASQQQRVGMDQITAAMESVSEASQQNATSARQLETAVEALKNLGERLNGIVGSYKL